VLKNILRSVIVELELKAAQFLEDVKLLMAGRGLRYSRSYPESWDRVFV
jgi:hypothetical protein